MTRKRDIEKASEEIISPIVAEMGLELIDTDYVRRSGEQLLCLYLDKSGGITVGELQQASRTLEKALEVADIVPGRYRLEVSSPGIDRPLKKPRDFARQIGSRVKVKLFSPLPDGRRHIAGTLKSAGESGITVEGDEGEALSIPLESIASARPVIDWDAMLRKPSPSGNKEPHARRSQ